MTICIDYPVIVVDILGENFLRHGRIQSPARGGVAEMILKRYLFRVLNMVSLGEAARPCDTLDKYANQARARDATGI